jgi:hypothetical protein
MLRTRYERICATAFAVAALGCAILWRAADHVYAHGDRAVGYWIGVAGCALPAAALTGCWIWLRRARIRGAQAASVPWLPLLLALSAMLLLVVLVFPYL